MNVKIIIEKCRDGIDQASFSDKRYYHFDSKEQLYRPNIETLEYDCEIDDSGIDYDEIISYEMCPETFSVYDFLKGSLIGHLKDAIILAYYNFNLHPQSRYNIHHVQKVYAVVSKNLKLCIPVRSNDGCPNLYSMSLCKK